MRAICGLLPVNQGEVRVRGADPRTDRPVHDRLALVPEEDSVPEALTARQLVRYTAALRGIDDERRISEALGRVDLLDAADRQVGDFSKGMRQRAKIAAVLVADPTVLVLDEPLNGADPVQRLSLISLFTSLGAEGRTVIVSSHVLHEVERLSSRIIVVLAGRLAAAGGHRAIRDAMADRPRRVIVRADDPRRLASHLLALDVVTGVEVEADTVTISTSNAGALAVALPTVAVDEHCGLREVRPLDESLEAVFRELTR
jgi:ABC-2 type transport system ATP-binding protein